jgi:antirestriction protein ArdC
MSKAVKQFNGLSGAVGVEEVKKIAILAEKEGQTTLVRRLQAALKEASKNNITVFNPGPLAIEEVPACDLPGIDHVPPYISAEDYHGLNKAVSPDEIYTMITNKLIAFIKEAKKGDYKKKWEAKKYGKGYLIPFNFASKKRYRGVNHFLLTDFTEPLENPFFLTFKQVEKLKGKVKKGSVGHEVVYFTRLYAYSQKEPALSFGTYDKKKFEKWFESNKHQIPKSQHNLDHALPILKYYKVFNGKNIEGIDFDLENFKTGYIENEMPPNVPMPIADAIVENFPKPQVPIEHGGDKAAYYPGLDYIKMPHKADFETAQDYYRTLFHELGHSTGAAKRLNRDFSGRFGSKKYAFEELIAELNAVFVSAEAGFMWHTNKNHAGYLKSWNSVLTQIEEDNRFVMRAASQAQKAADFILQPDKDGNPIYLKTLKNKISPKKENDQKKSKNLKEFKALIDAEAKEYADLERPKRKYKLGDKYRSDFDYLGLLKAAQKINATWTVEKMEKLFESFEDNNYHSIAKPLWTEISERKANGLNAPRHEGIAKEALSECGRLLPGYKYNKGGKIVKVETGKKKKPTAGTSKKDVAGATEKKAVVAKEEKKSTHRFTKGQTVQVSKRWGKTKAGTEGTVKELRKSAHGDPMYSVTIGKDLLFFPETVLQLPKKKLTTKELEEANPEPKAVKPKSVSVQTAVSDVLRLDKFNFKEVTPLKASLIFNLFKNIDLTEGETSVDNASDYALSVLKNDGPFHIYYDSSQEIYLTSLGAEFVNAVKNRLESLRNQKHNYALFDGLNGAKTEFNKHVMQSAKKGYSAAEIFILGYPHGELKKHLPAHLITLSGKVLKKAMAQTKDHNLNWGNIIDLPKNINNPQAIFKSKTKGFVVLTYVKDVNKKPVMVAVHLQNERNNLSIASIYARSNFNTYKNWIKEGLALFVDKKSELFPYAQATIAVGGNNPQSHKNTKTKPNSKKGGLKSPTIEPKTTAGGQSIGGSSRPLLSGKQTLKASDIASMSFETLPLDEGWQNLFQQAPKNMRIAVWAKPKNGKTATCAAFASYLTKFGPILYNFADQGINLSTKNLIEMTGLDKKPNAFISVTDNLNTLAEEIEATGAHHVVIDMINQYINNGVTPHIFKKEILQRFPEVGFTLVMEVTKGGDFKGDQAWTHLVDQLVTIENYIADTKGRYGTGEKITWEEGAKKYDPKRYAEIKGQEEVSEAPAQNEVLASAAENEEINFKVY